jgi:hypothetical protein
MLRMLEMAFPIRASNFKHFLGSVPQTPLFMRDMSATHVAFSRSYPPPIYYLTERSLFKKCPPWENP